MLSTHKVEVVPVVLRKHPNADSLSVVNVFGGYPCCVKTADWQDGDLAAYVPPDSVVDVSRPEFSFLGGGTKTAHKIRAIKLRGVLSMGLLLRAPEWAKEGDDLAEYFGVQHYEPEMKASCTGGAAEKAPVTLASLAKYDVDSMRRYTHIFTPREDVMVTEKIHGANSRYCYLDGRMWCGSRNEWKRQENGCLWWRALENTPTLGEFCRHHPGVVVYGEVYGDVQSFHYGLGDGEVRFAAFDVLAENGTFFDARKSRDCLGVYGVPQVPLIGILPFEFEAVCELAEGHSLMPGTDHIREGCVVKPVVERWHQSIGRVQLKVVGAGYLAKT